MYDILVEYELRLVTNLQRLRGNHTRNYGRRQTDEHERQRDGEDIHGPEHEHGRDEEGMRISLFRPARVCG
jgi:hypothetical protein